MEYAHQTEEKSTKNIKIYKIFSIIEKPGNEKNFWLDIGVGRLNRDDSITCKLDALPLNGVIQLRAFDNRRSNFKKNNNVSD